MQVGERVRQRMDELGLNQSQLARAVGLTQPAISALLTRNKTGSRSLHLIARELRTTPAYLTGEIDDPDAGAPPPPPEPQVVHIMLPVALPAGPALAAMFEGLILSLGDWQSMPAGELAQELATLLPTGLGAVRGPLRYEESAVGYAQRTPAEDHANGDRVPRRARGA